MGEPGHRTLEMTDRRRHWVRRALHGAAPKAALIALVVFVSGALLGSSVLPYDPNAMANIATENSKPPSLQHPFGTDQIARDVLARVVHGATVSLEIAGLSVLLALVIGTVVGAVAGYAGGWIDRMLMRAVDVLISIPRLLVLIVVVAALGQPSVWMLAVLLGCTGWFGTSRVVRARTREVSALEFVTAARALGASPFEIVTRHILPSVVPQALVMATLAVAAVIPLEAGLSFLGLGVEIPTPTWGSILLDAYRNGFREWWMLVFPGGAMLVTVLAINVLGERLRDALDPRMAAQQ